MNALTDLLSTIIFFLAWLFPVLIIIVTRRRTQEQRKTKAASVEKTQEGNKPAGKPKRFSGRPDELVSRLMDIQGIRQDNAVPVKEEPKKEVKPSVTYRENSQAARKVAPSPTSVSSQSKHKRKTPLEVIEKYPLNKRAIVLAALIGKPKAFSTRP